MYACVCIYDIYILQTLSAHLLEAPTGPSASGPGPACEAQRAEACIWVGVYQWHTLGVSVPGQEDRVHMAAGLGCGGEHMY